MPADSFVVAERFCGPPGAGNGGYVAGRLASSFDGPVEVTLRKPVPLGRRLSIDRNNGAALLRDGELLLAEARPADPALEPPRAVSLAEARVATTRFPRSVEHPLPGCFVCGTGRADGLRIFPGPVDDGLVVAAPWVPDESLRERGGSVSAEFVWAALDCTGAFAVNEPPRGLVLLGRMTARVDGRPRCGETCVVIGWPVADEGRKLIAGTALYAAAGRLLAIARATWIFVEGPHARA